MTHTEEEIEAQALPAATLSQRDWIVLSRGFSRIFWVFPLAILLSFHIVRIHASPFIRLPGYVLAVLLLYWGVTALYRIPLPRPRWRTWLGRAMLLIFMMLYFAPFVYWNQRQPGTDHYLVNFFALVGCAIWFMALLNRFMEEIAIVLDDPVFIMESRLCRWSVLLFSATPFFTASGLAIILAVRHHTSVSFEALQMIQRPISYWVQALALLPYTLTALLCWKTKEKCIHAIEPSPPPPTHQT